MAYCTQCGAQMRSGDTFCGACGNALPVPPRTATPTAFATEDRDGRTRSSLPLALVITGLALVLLRDLVASVLIREGLVRPYAALCYLTAAALHFWVAKRLISRSGPDLVRAAGAALLASTPLWAEVVQGAAFATGVDSSTTILVAALVVLLALLAALALPKKWTIASLTAVFVLFAAYVHFHSSYHEHVAVAGGAVYLLATYWLGLDLAALVWVSAFGALAGGLALAPTVGREEELELRRYREHW